MRRHGGSATFTRKMGSQNWVTSQSTTNGLPSQVLQMAYHLKKTAISLKNSHISKKQQYLKQIAIISKGGCPEIGLRTGFLNVSVDVLALVPRNDLKIGSIILTRRDGEVWRGPENL